MKTIMMREQRVHIEEPPRPAPGPGQVLVKQLNLKFSYYYTPEEYAKRLALLATGDVPWQHMITGTVGMAGIPDAFEHLLAPNQHVKVILEPGADHPLRTYH